MPTPSPHPSERRLEGLGISEAAEAAYISLLRHSATPTPSETAELHRAGLLYHSHGVDIPVSIDSLISSWSRARAAEEVAIRSAASALQELFEDYDSRHNSGEVIRLLRGKHEVIAAGDQLTKCAQHSIDDLIRPPFVYGAANGIPEQQPAAMARGVHYRAIYESRLLTEPSIFALVEESIQLGEAARAAKDIPLRLFIADREKALVVLPHPSGSGNDLLADDADGLLLFPSPMLDALARLFDQVWNFATPLGAVAKHAKREGETDVLLSLLATGMTDAAIASTLGLSERTVHRRIATISARFGTSSRFQLGVMLAQRGLVPRASRAPSTDSR